MTMMRVRMGLAAAAGLMAGALAWAASSSSVDSYAKVEAESLVRSPQNSWARAILFTDVLKTPPDGRTKRLGRTEYREMILETAGSVWVPADISDKFQTLQAGSIYSFAGIVDQVSRRYYVIVDACYTIQTADNLKEHWTDMLNPAAETAATDVSEPALQALLVEAQSRLIQLAKENNTTVANLIEMQTDGGQRIAANIVADALQGELRAQNKTAEELMIGAVLALLQKQSVLEESAKVGSETPATEEIPVPEPEAQEQPATRPEETPGEAEPAPVAMAEEMPPATVEESAAAADVPEEVPAEGMIAELPAETPAALEPEPVVLEEELPADTAEKAVAPPESAEEVSAEDAISELLAQPPPVPEPAPIAMEEGILPDALVQTLVPSEAAEGVPTDDMLAELLEQTPAWPVTEPMVTEEEIPAVAFEAALEPAESGEGMPTEDAISAMLEPTPAEPEPEAAAMLDDLLAGLVEEETSSTEAEAPSLPDTPTEMPREETVEAIPETGGEMPPG